MQIDVKRQALKRVLVEIGIKDTSFSFMLERYIRSEQAFLDLSGSIIPADEKAAIEASVMDSIFILRLMEE
jgi:hypothetical protein